MTQTVYLDGLDELPELFASIEEDFERINLTELMIAELDHLAEWESTLFANQMDPTGTPWPKNAPRTIKEKGHSRILRGHPRNQHRLQRSLITNAHTSTGDMVREAIQTDTGGHLAFGSTVPYGPLHDKARANVPARPHVGINANYLDMMTERVADYTLKKLAQ